MSDRILHIIQHSLGCDQYGRGEQYRNHFVTGEYSVDFPICIAATLFGLMKRRSGNPLSGGDDVFNVTPEGKQWMADNSPAPPKLSRSQRRYQAYLDADWFVGNFREWIGCWKEPKQGLHA